MIITLSPAKLIDFETKTIIQDSTIPMFEEQARELISNLKEKSIEQVASLMNINPKQANEVYQYIQVFNIDSNPRKQSLFTYCGIAFQGLDANTLSSQDINFAQKKLMIFSGLYGILRPLDIIQPYRLEMQARLSNGKGNNLYEFWREVLTDYFITQLKSTGKVWVDLMSSEYSKVIDRKLLPKDIQIITPVFKEETEKGYKQIVVYTKKARGLMTRFILQHKIEDPEYLKAFDLDGYKFSAQLSGKKEWVFIR